MQDLANLPLWLCLFTKMSLASCKSKPMPDAVSRKPVLTRCMCIHLPQWKWGFVCVHVYVLFLAAAEQQKKMAGGCVQHDMSDEIGLCVCMWVCFEEDITIGKLSAMCLQVSNPWLLFLPLYLFKIPLSYQLSSVLCTKNLWKNLLRRVKLLSIHPSATVYCLTIRLESSEQPMITDMNSHSHLSQIKVVSWSDIHVFVF